jgi:hypothetical protein
MMLKAVQYAILTATSPQGTREKNTLEAERKTHAQGGMCSVGSSKRDGKIKRRDVRSQDVWPKNISLYLHELPQLLVKSQFHPMLHG